MIIQVLTDNWRAEFEGGLSTLGDFVPAALNKTSRGYGDTVFMAGFKISHAAELLH